MNKKLYKDLLILVIVILVSVIGLFRAVEFFSPDKIIEKKSQGLSIQTEKSLGKLVKQQILLDANISTAPITTEALSLMKEYLTPNKSDFKFDIEIILVNSNTVNAVALPGGTIIVYSGLIKAANDQREVMAVIAHELGHLYYRDSYNSVLRSTGISIILSVISGGESEIISDIINNLLALKFSRDIESRADDYAIKLLLEQGTDPIYLGTFFEALDKLYDVKEENSPLSRYFTTHPFSKDRILKSKEASTSYVNTKDNPEFNWEAIKDEQPSFF
ncbi:MAG: M48 family metallopeptidase [Spirochaetaceae bacterium]